nr:DUF4143 domain-containing protein [Sulfitobacter sp. HGT1]
MIDQMAARSAQEINISELAKLSRLQPVTVEQYLDILIRLSMPIKLGAWTSGVSKREIKNPKYHFADSGIACALRRFTKDTFSIENNWQALGGLLESFVLNELLRAVPMQVADQREIDILIDGGSLLVCVEIKASASVCSDDFKHLKWFSKDGPGRSRTCTGIVFYPGQEKFTFGDRRFALPVSALWNEVKV